MKVLKVFWEDVYELENKMNWNTVSMHKGGKYYHADHYFTRNKHFYEIDVSFFFRLKFYF